MTALEMRNMSFVFGALSFVFFVMVLITGSVTFLWFEFACIAVQIVFVCLMLRKL